MPNRRLIMTVKYESLVKDLKKLIETNIENPKSVDNKKILMLLDKLVDVVDMQTEEIKNLEAQLSVFPAHETTFDPYQLELLEYIYTNETINEIKLNEFCKKDQKYRVAFTQLKDDYIYKGFGDIYNNSPNYHIKPDKEKYIVGELTRLGRI